jgi:small GTP-binding protein
MTEEFDLIFKIVIIGDSGVGKTNLIGRYLKNEYKEDSKATVGVEFGEKKYEINGLKIKAQIWDTAGQERYRAITSMYYKGAKGGLIVFDLSSKSTFQNVEKWFNEIKKTADPTINLILIGNKSDLKDKRQISTEEGENKAKEMNVAYLETSALNADNVDKAFDLLIQEITKKMKKEIEEEEYEENDIHDDNKIQDVKENKTINLNTNNKVSEGNLKKNCCQNIPILKDKK